MLIFRIAAIAAALSLVACAAPFHRPLTAENKQRIQSVDVRMVIPQESFMVSAKSPGVSLAAGGGLIGAMIDSGIQKSRQAEMAGEIRSTVGSLARFDLRQEADIALQAALKEPAAGGGLPFVVRSAQVLAAVPGKSDAERLFGGTSNGPAVMMLLVHYALEPGLGAFTTRTSAVLRQDGKMEPSFQSAAVYQIPLSAGSREVVLAQLTANDGQLLRSYMRESVRETLRMVALDWEGVSAGAVSTPAGNARVPRFNMQGTVMDLPSVTVMSEGTRMVVRNETGTLFSLQKEFK
ncbi:hypothetical protein [Acidovorax sp.]|uniref:hypothetical protein n=1 Tax=Acidovorax sp. TaxID=1872122 RepID=UPI0026293279|nr:hypothetical protein [Acidovorax sp.]